MTRKMACHHRKLAVKHLEMLASMAPTQEAKACAAPEDGTHVTRTRSGSESHHYEDEITINVPSQTAQEGQVEATLVGRLADHKSSVGFVLTHPYGPLGGNLYCNVVSALALYLQVRGFTTLRFNFRGVAGSTGRATWGGGGERNDVKAACKYLLDLPTPPKHLVLIGYSYGSIIGGSVLDDIPELSAFAAISYPFGVAWALTLFQGGHYITQAKTAKPKLFVMGTKDNFTGLGNFESHVKSFPSPLDVVTVKEMDHFWFTYESTLCRVVSEWLQKVFGVSELKELAVQPADQVKVAEQIEDRRQDL